MKINFDKYIILNLFIFFLIGPIFTFPLIIYGIVADKKHIRIYLFLVSLALSYIAFNFEPLIQDDLFRHYEDITKLSSLNFFDAAFRDVNIVNNIIFYILGNLGLHRIYPVIGTIITFFLCFESILIFTNKYKVTNLQFLLIIILAIILWPFRLVTSGVRNFVVLSVMIYWFIAREEKIESWKSICLLLVCFFIHAYTIVIFIFIIWYRYLPKKYNAIALVMLILCVVFGDSVAKSFIDFPVIGYYATKFSAYRNVVTNYDLYSMCYIGFRILFLLIILMLYKKFKIFDERNRLLVNITIVSVFLNMKTFTERNILLVGIVSLLLLIPILEKNKNRYKGINTNTIFLTCLILIFAVISYPALRNYPLHNSLLEIMTTSIFL